MFLSINFFYMIYKINLNLEVDLDFLLNMLQVVEEIEKIESCCEVTIHALTNFDHKFASSLNL